MSAEQLELFPLANIEGAVELPKPPDLSPAHLLTEALPPFTEYMRDRELAENTVKSFLHDLGLLVTYLGEDATLGQCSTPVLEGFLRWLRYERDAPCSLRSLDRRITTLKVLFQWLASNRVLQGDPAEALIHYGATSPLPEVLNEAQISRVLEATASMRDASEAPDARPHLLVTLLLETAVKKTECLHIGLEHLDFSDLARPSVYIHYEKPRMRFKRRRLALPDDFVPTFEAYMRRYQPKERLLECTGRNLEYVLHNLSLVAGLETKLTVEMLRWTSACRSLRAGVEPERLRRRLGLSRIAWRETWATLQDLTEGPL